MDNNYILLDAARMHGDIYGAREMNPDHSCLYEGDSEKFLSAVAPWLFNLVPGSSFAQWITERATAQSWGVLLTCQEDPVKLYKHLRNFLIVKGEDGREMYFRYYDPRVLRVFLPTCKHEQLREFFGPIATFAAEDPNGLVMEFSLDDVGELAVNETGMGLGEYLDPQDPTTRFEIGTQIAEEPKKRWDFGY